MSLAISGLSYAYGAKQALIDAEFGAKSGRFTALLGPNGAGKSTLFGVLSGLLRAQDGQITVAGHDMTRAPRKALARMGIVFQQSTLDLDLTVHQNLMYFAALRGLAGRAARDRIDQALDRLEMRERAAEKVRALNGGHRRRTEIARALLHSPDILLLDEPTVGLDAASRQAITGHVHDLADAGLAVLWATHLTDEVRKEDDLVVLHQGRVLASGTVHALVGEQSLRSYFLYKTGGMPADAVPQVPG
ncbi:MAG: ABC transporter ATP-binding protein [Pseudomonadota bacterium]